VQFNSTPDAQEMAFKASPNMPFSLAVNFANVFLNKKRLEN